MLPPVASSEAHDLPTNRLALYAIPMVGVNFSLVLLIAYITKYSVDVLLIAPAAIGAVEPHQGHVPFGAREDVGSHLDDDGPDVREGVGAPGFVRAGLG